MKKVLLILIALVTATTLISCGRNSELDLLKNEINELKQIIEQKDNEAREQNYATKQREKETEELWQTIEQKNEELEELNDALMCCAMFKTPNDNCPYSNCPYCIRSDSLKDFPWTDKVPDCKCFNCSSVPHFKGFPILSYYDYESNGGNYFVAGKNNSAIYLPCRELFHLVSGIEPFAFSGDLSSVIIIPDNITQIGEQAFANCENLGIIYFLSDTPPEFGNNVFLNAGINQTRNIAVSVPPRAIPAYRAVEQLQGFDFVQHYMYRNIHCNNCLKIICECEY